MITVTSEEEFNEVLDKATTSVVALFTAPAWCIPCRQFKPAFEAVAESAANEFDFVVVDIDENAWAVEKFSIRGVPAARLYNDLGVFVRDVKVPQNAVPFLNDIRS